MSAPTTGDGRLKSDERLVFIVPGRPAGQGSMSLFRHPSTGREVAKYPAKTVDHRNLAVSIITQTYDGRPALAGPVLLVVEFLFARPKGHYRTGRRAGELRPDAPDYQTGFPDLDKMLRLVGDALTIAGVIKDDSQIVAVEASKEWAPDGAASRTVIELVPLAAPPR